MKRQDSIHVPEFAHEVQYGYPVQMYEEVNWDLVVHVYAPMVPSPRPRVTRTGTFMPAEYRKHCDMMSCSMAYARGLLEGRKGNEWDSKRYFKLDLAFWSQKKRGDLDNVAKTIMDAAQLKRGEEPGAELWVNDSQICSLSVDWIPVEDEGWEQVVVRVRGMIMELPAPAKKSRAKKVKP